MTADVDDRRETEFNRGEQSGEQSPSAAPEGEAGGPQPEPLRSVHTTSFPQILQNRGISVLVTTYQAGRLVVLRADGGVLNTHFRSFSKPMGLAVRGNRLAIGLETEIGEYHNLPAVAPKVKPEGKHDACFLPLDLYDGRHPNS